MKRLSVISLALALLLVGCDLVTNAPITPKTSDELATVTVPSGGETALVVHVPDGDSLRVEIAGVSERVRIIGINAPEGDECLGPESRDALRDLVDGRLVILVADEEDTDQYGRLLRYVWVEDTFINQTQAATGMAISHGFPPNITLQEILDEAEAFATSRKLGIWDPAACGGSDAAPLEIAFVVANPAGRDEENLNQEYVLIENPTGSDVDLTGWVLRDSSTSNRFEFPEGAMIRANDRLVVRSGCGDNDHSELFWCSNGPIWDNGGDEAFLLSPGGAIIATHQYDEQR